jgi:hypothetical protein
MNYLLPRQTDEEYHTVFVKFFHLSKLKSKRKELIERLFCVEITLSEIEATQKELIENIDKTLELYKN